MESSNISLFVNAGSRRGEELFKTAKAALQPVNAKLCQSIEELEFGVRQAVASGTAVVAVGGGDGTFSLIARHLAGSKSTLGVLPLGTGNAFARDLGIPNDIEAACNIIKAGRCAEIDLGHAGGDYFVNVATVGLTTRIARELTDAAKKRLGKAVYAFALVRALLKVEPFHVEITSPEGDLSFDTLLVVVGNGRYHAGPFPLSPDATITDGKLTVYGLASTSRLAFLKLAWNMRTGRHVEISEVRSLRMTSGTLTTTPKREMVIDGEITRAMPVEFKIVPKAIRALVPADFDMG